jgi:hypothetical protein
MTKTVTEDAVGKSVVDARGNAVGIVVDVKHGTAYVEPDPDITDKLTAKLGWTEAGEESYPLQEAAVETVTDDEVRLREDL